MKKTIKRISMIFLLMISVLSLFIGCRGSGDKPNAQDTLKLNFTTYSVNFLETFEIKTVEGNIETNDLIFETSDSNVCSVNELGVVTGTGIGSAKVTVKFGNLVGECAVTVAQKNLNPIVAFNNVYSESITIKENTPIDLNCYVSYDGGRYSDLTLTYDISNKAAGKIENGIFTANAVSDTPFETDVIVTAAWRGFSCPTLTKMIKIKVIDGSEQTSEYIAVNGAVDVDTINLTVGEEIDFVIKHVLNGVEDSAFVLLQDGDSVFYNDGKLKAMRTGDTTITIRSKNYTEDSPETAMMVIEIKVA